MKFSHFVALLKNDFYFVWVFLILGLVYTWLGVKDYRQDHMFFLTPDTGGTFLFVIPFMAWNLLFQNGNYRSKTNNALSPSSLEFMFTRAIDRTSLFAVKTSLFLALSLVPLVGIWAYSHVKPMIRVELPYYTQQHRVAAREFYLTHFEGSYLQEPDTGNNQDYVVLPQGRPDQAAYTLVVTFAATLLYQAALFTFWRIRWMPFVTFFVLIMLSSFAGLSSKTPSLYETGLAWVTQHVLLVLFGLGLLAVLSQPYCCRRFVTTEITS